MPSRTDHSTARLLPTVDFLVEIHPAKSASPSTSILLSNSVHGYLEVIRGYLIVLRATLLRAMRSPAQGVWPVRGKEVEPGRHALEQLQFFSSEKIILLFDFFRRLAPFSMLRNSLI